MAISGRDKDDKEARRLADEEFCIERSRAINMFAAVEDSLREVLKVLLIHPPILQIHLAEPQNNLNAHRISALIFANLQTFRARINTIDEMLKIRHGDQHTPFFDSLIKKLGGLNADRNKIVHWIQMHANRSGEVFDPKKDISLMEHPNGDREFYKHEIAEFTKKADFYRLLIFYFGSHLQFGETVPGEPQKKSWSVVFTEAVTYPPPDTHPLYRARS